MIMDALKEKVALSNLPGKELVIRACEFAERRHADQFRKSGEPFICHPDAVGHLLFDISQSAEVIAAGVLHDVVEDTSTRLDEVGQIFNDKVSFLVNGVTQEKICGADKVGQKRIYYHKLVAMLRTDPRIIIIRFADRLHNMRTLDSLPAENRQRIARETLEVYIPLALLIKNWFPDFPFQDISHWLGELYSLSYKYLGITLDDLIQRGCEIEGGSVLEKMVG